MRAAALIPIRCARRSWRQKAGADGITAHLREDRRHISDADIERLARGNKSSAQSGNGGDRRDARHRAARTSRTPPASFRKSARSAPPKAASTRRASTIASRRWCASWATRTSASRCSSKPDRAQLDAAKSLGAPVVELHTGAYCEADSRRQRAKSMLAAHPRCGGLWRVASGSKSMPAMASASKRQAHRRHSRNPRIEHRPFPDRRSDLHRAGCGNPAHARADGRGARRMILGLGSDLIDIRRIEKTHRALRRPLSHARLHRCRTREIRRPRATAPPAMPSASPPRRRAPRRWARGFAGRLLARHGRGQSAGRQAHHETHRRRACKRLREITPAGIDRAIDLSITDDFPLAQAIVIISAVAVPPQNGAKSG